MGKTTTAEKQPWEAKHDWGNTVLRPRNEGEELKIQQVDFYLVQKFGWHFFVIIYVLIYSDVMLILKLKS